MEDNLGLFLLTWRLYRLLIVQSGSYFIGWWKPNMKFTEQYFSVVLFIHRFFFTLYGGSSFWVSF